MHPVPGCRCLLSGNLQGRQDADCGGLLHVKAGADDRQQQWEEDGGYYQEHSPKGRHHHQSSRCFLRNPGTD